MSSYSINKMRVWMPAMQASFVILALYVSSSAAYSGFPKFPTADDSRVVLSTHFNSADDDIIEDEPIAPIKITHMRVRSEIALRYARTAIVSNVYNPSRKPQEATFHVLLPEFAFISGFTMSIDKETYDAYVKEKEVASQIYNTAVSQGVSAAHIATKARDSNDFTIKFNLEGKTNATYRLRYEEFLVRRNGVYNHAINLHPGALVPKMDVVIHIKESQKISKLRVPELRTGNEIDATEEDAQYTKAAIQRGTNGREATITFKPDLAEQRRLAELYVDRSKRTGDPDHSDIGYDSAEDESENAGLLGQFVVQYDVEQPKNGEILVNDGYFVHFFAPNSLPPLSKHVVFVLDTSYSMEGNKIDQLRQAMGAILPDLLPHDYFSIVEFNSYIIVHDLEEADRPVSYGYPQSQGSTTHQPALASPENIIKAKTIISRLVPEGGTNIYDALDVALNIIQKGVNQTNPISSGKDYNNSTDKTNELEPIIIFLTDGEPTVGETYRDRIVTLISEKNSGDKRAPLFSLAFGDSAERSFLRKLSLRNEGFMRQIYEAADAALQLHDFYRQVSSPLLANVKFLYPRRQIKEGSVSQSQFRTINDGSEVAVVGKIAEHTNEITPQVVGYRGGDGRGREPYELNPKVPVTRTKDDHLPLERLWAYLTIKQLLDKRDAEDNINSESDDNPEKKALAVALKYSFVTPLTSLVVVRLNKTKDVEPVEADEVDEPTYLPFRSSALTQLSPVTYTGVSTGDLLSVASARGPVLVVQSIKRFNSASAGYSHGSSSYGSSSYSSSYGSSYGQAVFQQGSFVSSGHSVQGYVQNFSSTLPPPPPPPTRPSYQAPPENYDNAGGIPHFSFPPFTAAPPSPSNFSTSPTVTTASTLSATTNYTNAYHLEGYEWVLPALNIEEDSIVFFNSSGSKTSLKLSKNIDPPRADKGDIGCSSINAPTQSASLVPEKCVYITRCFAARYIDINIYENFYCSINDRYAGICCPSGEVDRKP